MEAFEQRGGVKGVVLDAALFRNGCHTHVEKLLHRLFYSSMRVGILFRDSDSGNVEMERVEECLPSKQFCDIKYSSDRCLNSCINEFCILWQISTAQSIFITLSLIDSLKEKMTNDGWHICLPLANTKSDQGSDDVVNLIKDFYIQTVCINKRICHDVTTVGYSMKWTRELDFLKRGALPLNITHKKLSFTPLNLELPLSEQLKIVDVLLHKPTDEIASADLGETGSLQDQIRFTDAMQRLIQFLSNCPQICVVDPVERILPIVDRALTQETLLGLSDVEYPVLTRIRAPRYTKILKFDNASEVLKGCDFSLPAIAKPQIACGVSDAHIMAVVFKEEGFQNLPIPVPSIVQEYIDHGSTVYKFYVIGEKLFYTVRKSTPNAAKVMESSCNSNIPAFIVFDSLKPLPKHFVVDDISVSDSLLESHVMERLDLQLVSAAALWLREKLKLTIFGFDVVIELATNDHVIIDMNFFPTFKDVEDKRAVQAFWDALLNADVLHKQTKADSFHK